MYDPQFHVVLHQPEIPPNTGNIARTCVATAAKLWLVRPLGYEINDYYLRRAGMDYWQYLCWEVVDDWQDLTRKLPLEGPWLFTKKATQLYHEVEYQWGDVFVFGSESSGLPDSILNQWPDTQLRLPMRQEVRSLNLSNTVAVAVYEALRQLEWPQR